MLSSLLPGVREIRAPLAAGFLWLLALALLLEGSIPPYEQATGVFRLAYDLHALLSVVGVSAVSSFAAYLAGTLSVALLVGGFPRGRLWRPPVRFVPRPRLVGLRRGARQSLRAPFGDRGHRALSLLGRNAVDRLHPVVVALAVAQREADRAGESSHEGDAYYLCEFPAASRFDVHHAALERVARIEVTRRYGGGGPGPRRPIDGLVNEAGELGTLLRSAAAAYRSLGPKPESVPVRRSLTAVSSSRSSYWSIEQPARSVLEEAVADLVVADLELMRTRLLRPETHELSSAIDRLRSEAELRIALIAPLVAFLCILAADTGTPAWLAGIGGVVVLAREALRRRREAGDMLLDAVNDRVASPALERLDADVARVTDGLGALQPELALAR
jgi:hypothetical protein